MGFQDGEDSGQGLLGYDTM